jgi:hypothetical protein
MKLVKKPKESKVIAMRRRVAAVLNAISDLQEGDLLVVLDLDRYCMEVEYDVATFRINILAPGCSASLFHSLRSGEELAQIFEQQLMSVYYQADGTLDVYGKKHLNRKELGGAYFDGKRTPL